MPELQSDNAPRESATAEDYKATFEGFKPGQAVLEDLLGRFHDRPVYVRGGIAAQRETEARAAQNEVVGYILRKLGQFEQEKKDA